MNVKRIARIKVKLPLIAYLGITLAFVLGLVTYINTQDDRILRSRIATCEQVKLDRIDTIRSWTQAEKAWIVRASDLKNSPRERAAARNTIVTYHKSARNLSLRLYECKPLVKDLKKIIDARALAEAHRSNPTDP